MKKAKSIIIMIIYSILVTSIFWILYQIENIKTLYFILIFGITYILGLGLIYLYSKEKEAREEWLKTQSNIIKKENIPTYFTDLKRCDEQTTQLLVSYHTNKIKKIGIPLILLLFVYSFFFIFFKLYGSRWIITIIFILIILYNFILILLEKRKISIIQSEELFYCPILIYDRTHDEHEHSTTYYVKIKNQNNYMLDDWYKVDENVYTSNTATLYYANHNGKSLIEIIKEEN